jgi:hypothetical protein
MTRALIVALAGLTLGAGAGTAFALVGVDSHLKPDTGLVGAQEETEKPVARHFEVTLVRLPIAEEVIWPARHLREEEYQSRVTQLWGRRLALGFGLLGAAVGCLGSLVVLLLREVRGINVGRADPGAATDRAGNAGFRTQEVNEARPGG